MREGDCRLPVRPGVPRNMGLGLSAATETGAWLPPGQAAGVHGGAGAGFIGNFVRRRTLGLLVKIAPCLSQRLLEAK